MEAASREAASMEAASREAVSMEAASREAASRKEGECWIREWGLLRNVLMCYGRLPTNSNSSCIFPRCFDRLCRRCMLELH